jgi:hypothetical protein
LAGKGGGFLKRFTVAMRAKNKQRETGIGRQEKEGGYAGQKVYDNNSMRAGCIGIQQRKECFPFGVW